MLSPADAAAKRLLVERVDERDIRPDPQQQQTAIR